MKLTLRLSIALLCTMLGPVAYGWLRMAYEDAVIVQRSELIVVGHLVRGSVVRERPAPGFVQYKAVLVITEVLKGENKNNEIPITIYYGLTPMVGWHINEDDIQADYRMFHSGAREDSIPIFDTGSSAMSSSPICADAGEDNLWFLRRRSGNYGREPGTAGFGIVDPEDIQTLSLKQYFKAYLSDDPEGEIRRQMQLNGDLERRARRYVDHLEVQRILALPEPRARTEALLPFYIKGQSWFDEKESIYEARKGILDCGKIGAAYLQQLFDDPILYGLREDIIGIWGDLRFEPAVDPLITVLKQNERFWSEQPLEEGWWNNSVESELGKERRRNYRELYSSVVALGKIGNPRATEAIQLTRKQWVLIDYSEIIKECDAALAKLRQSDRTNKENK